MEIGFAGDVLPGSPMYNPAAATRDNYPGPPGYRGAAPSPFVRRRTGVGGPCHGVFLRAETRN